MGDFFQSLAELALGTAPLVSPLATTMFGPAPQVGAELPEPSPQAALDDGQAPYDPAARPGALPFDAIAASESAPFDLNDQQATAFPVVSQEDAPLGARTTPDFRPDVYAAPRAPASSVGADQPVHRQAGLPSVDAVQLPELLLEPGTAQAATLIPALHEISAALAAFGDSPLPARPQPVVASSDLPGLAAAALPDLSGPGTVESPDLPDWREPSALGDLGNPPGEATPGALSSGVTLDPATPAATPVPNGLTGRTSALAGPSGGAASPRPDLIGSPHALVASSTVSPVSNADASQAETIQQAVPPAINAGDLAHASPGAGHVEQTTSGVPDEFDSAIPFSIASGERILEPSPGSEASAAPVRSVQAAPHARAQARASDTTVEKTMTHASPQPTSLMTNERPVFHSDLTGVEDVSDLNAAPPPTPAESSTPAAPPNSIGPVIQRQILSTSGATGATTPVSTSARLAPSAGVSAGREPAATRTRPGPVMPPSIGPANSGPGVREDFDRPAMAAAAVGPAAAGGHAPAPGPSGHAPGPALAIQPAPRPVSLPPAPDVPAAQTELISPAPVVSGADVLPLVAVALPLTASEVPSGRSAAGATGAPPPHVRVTIGRIDVRVAPAPAAAPARRPGSTRPAPSLADYLKGGAD